MNQVGEVLISLFSIKTLLISGLGTLLGVIMGAIPGMNGGIGVAVLLPFTYAMDPASGLLFLGGIYMGSSYGGSISGILINCPGTVESACTTIEGNAMIKDGRGKEALYYSVLASTVGGIIGVVALIFFTPTLAQISVKFGPPEMFLVALCGLTIVGSLTGNNISKGIFAALFGLFFAIIGIDDITGVSRFTFGYKPLIGGMDLIPVVIGFFAISEMIKQAGELNSRTDDDVNITLEEDLKARNIFRTMITKFRGVLIKSSLVGTLIGILPGTGGAIASFLAYGEAKSSSKNPEKFGNGAEDGVIASESANNAAVGASLIPMLALGIPGSSTSAIMFGALTIHGLIPGPRLFVENGTIAYTFAFGMLFTVIFMLLIGVYGIPLFSNILKIKMEYIIPAVIACSFIGAYSVRNSMADVTLAAICAVLGVAFSKLDIPTTPIILGLILGPLIEKNLMRRLTISGAAGDSLLKYILIRPLSIGIIVLTAYLIYANLKVIKKQRIIKEDINDPEILKFTEGE